jgi:hypothetical protein
MIIKNVFQLHFERRFTLGTNAIKYRIIALATNLIHQRFSILAEPLANKPFPG